MSWNRTTKSSPSDPSLRVALDATPLLGKRTGVGEFCLGALRGLAASGRCDVKAFVVSWRGRKGVEPLLPSGVQRVGLPMPARPIHQAWRAASMPRVEWFTGKLNVVHGTNFVVPPSKAARIVTVHDLTMIRFPYLCQASSLAFPSLIKKAVNEGAWVHVPSNFVASEVQELLGVSPERIRSVHHGIPQIDSTENASESKDSLGLPAWVGRYVLAMGTIEPRKGLPALVRAFDQIADGRADLALVLAGPDGWGAEELEEAIRAIHHGQQVIRLGWVGEQRRATLLDKASCLAYPSLYEGFGIPPLEAMARGVPVVATNVASLPEVLGDAALLVQVDDSEGLAEAIVSVLEDASVRTRMVQRGLQWVKRFSWQACSEGLLDLYENAMDATT